MVEAAIRVTVRSGCSCPRMNDLSKSEHDTPDRKEAIPTLLGRGSNSSKGRVAVSQRSEERYPQSPLALLLGAVSGVIPALPPPGSAQLGAGRLRMSTPSDSVILETDRPCSIMSATQSSIWEGLIRRTGIRPNRGSIRSRHAVS